VTASLVEDVGVVFWFVVAGCLLDVGGCVLSGKELV
jgi:hypothetical protein